VILALSPPVLRILLFEEIIKESPSIAKKGSFLQENMDMIINIISVFVFIVFAPYN
jgi:hypothetical protein